MFMLCVQEVHWYWWHLEHVFPSSLTKGNAKGKNKKHLQKCKIRYSLTENGFISELVNGQHPLFSNCIFQFLGPQ